MPPISIFDGIVSDENNYSKLLCNLLNRSKQFRVAFLGLTPKAASHGDFVAKPHKEHDEGGIPDIKLCFDDGAEYFIEVKSNRRCPTTYYQNLAYGEPDSLTFLVPIGYCSEIPARAERRFWNELSAVIRNAEQLNNDSLVQEFRMLIESKFPVVRLASDEAKRLGTYNKRDLASLVIALRRAIVALQQHFDSARVFGQKLNTVFDSEEDEFGFEIRVDDQPLLWVGVWRSEGLLLAAAYDQAWGHNGDFLGFSESRTNQDWKVLSLEQLVLSGSIDIVSEVINRLEGILELIISAKHT